MANGPGVSLRPMTMTEGGEAAPGSTWRVRWREWAERDGKRIRRQREKKFHHPPGSRSRTPPPAASKFYADTLRRLEEGELPDLTGPVRIEVCSFDQAVGAWMRHKGARGVTQSTLDKYAQRAARWFATVRELEGLSADAPIRADRLTRDLFSRAILDWRRAGLAESTVYATAQTMLAAWTWAADDPKAWPGVPQAPRDKSTILPLPPVYHAPVEPTLAECDACIRHLKRGSYVARGAGVIMRYTGLRISQVLAIRREDLDVSTLSLTVTTGKSRRERTQQRVIPVSQAMLDDLAPYMGGEGEGLIRRRKDLRAPTNRGHHPSGTIRRAWEAATAAGEARREVWDPPNRKIARPEHAFRAALQGHLEGKGWREEVIDALVGHAGRSTRRRHYASGAALMGAMREAVDNLPPIDWLGKAAEEEDSNVVPFTG